MPRLEGGSIDRLFTSSMTITVLGAGALGLTAALRLAQRSTRSPSSSARRCAVVTVDYRDHIPPFQTPIRNLWTASMFQVYPHDRGHSIELAERLVSAVRAK